jgi:hypothetical protein
VLSGESDLDEEFDEMMKIMYMTMLMMTTTEADVHSEPVVAGGYNIGEGQAQPLR